jgi:hypothetical protein
MVSEEPPLFARFTLNSSNNMRNFLKLLILVTGLTFGSAYGQETELRTKKHLGKVNLLAPGIEYEGALGDFTTIDVSGNIGFQLATFDDFDETEIEFFVRPSIEAQLRQYYNYQKRDSKGKNTLNNSANFIALYTTYMFQPFNQPDNSLFETGSVFAIGPVWGINRTYNSGLALSLILGAGYYNEKYEVQSDNSYFSIIGNFKLGFAIGRDK